ncbi:hypothetical protein HanXRQr2_Chr06g0265661 [Helianthus annuus]|uniref:Uncharacterized protein n=1 Tax=Helianthus annuus TaxID=4232 RepID=A0A9K3NJV9_HELAN|nr:hypothetical protein HanXRQr2_Chr06g0265661 [Helianthus annuus]
MVVIDKDRDNVTCWFLQDLTKWCSYEIMNKFALEMHASRKRKVFAIHSCKKDIK